MAELKDTKGIIIDFRCYPLDATVTALPDGTETQRKGIIPDIIRKPSIRGIKRKQDELLDAAIELID